LAARTGIGEPGRVIAGTLMFAVIYLAIGAVVHNPVNGTVLILFIWIMDVFFGPGLGSPDRAATRWLPTHFATLWMVDLPSRHGGRLGDLGWALVWTIAALATAGVVLTATTRVARRAPRRTRAGTGWDQFTAGLRLGVRDFRRNPVPWVLLITVPVVFIWLSKVITPQETMSLTLVEDGSSSTLTCLRLPGRERRVPMQLNPANPCPSSLPRQPPQARSITYPRGVVYLLPAVPGGGTVITCPNPGAREEWSATWTPRPASRRATSRGTSTARTTT
jgi:hypothetical protein